MKQKTIGSYYKTPGWPAFIRLMALIWIIILGKSPQSLAGEDQNSFSFNVQVREEQLEHFPCQSCHEDAEIDNSEGEGDWQEHKNIILEHGILKCRDCHYVQNRDYLRNLDHKIVPFSAMEEICSPCHNREYKEWREGIHGKLTGFWNQKPKGLRCVECHDVHSPKAALLKPAPAPQAPSTPPDLFSLFNKQNKNKENKQVQ